MDVMLTYLVLLIGLVSSGQEMPDNIRLVGPAFQLFKTHNNWNFLLLDTRHGDVWQVQYSVQEEYPRFKIKIPFSGSGLRPRSSQLFSDTNPRPGRFTLVTTFNNWNFILLDQDTGHVWQCQFSIESDSPRFIQYIPLQD